MAESGCLPNLSVKNLQTNNLVVSNGSFAIPSMHKATVTSFDSAGAAAGTATGIGAAVDLSGFEMGTVIKMTLVLSSTGATVTTAKKEKIGVATCSNTLSTGATVVTAIHTGTISGEPLAASKEVAYTCTVIVTQSATSETTYPASLGCLGFMGSARFEDGTTTSEATTLANTGKGVKDNTGRYLMWTFASENNANITGLSAYTLMEVLKPSQINM